VAQQVNYQVLDSINAVRINTGMFIGDTENPNHLATEIIDNMLDEVANNFATIGKIFIDNESNSFWVQDNGRGLKLGTTIDPDTNKSEDSIKLLCTKLFSGSKFRINDEIDYKIQIGMHGVGLVVVNALSEWLVIRICKNNIVTEYIFIDSKFEDKKEYKKTNEDFSTQVGFKPNKKFFGTDTFDSKLFVERLLLAQSVYSNASFFVNDQKVPKISLIDYARNVLTLDKDETLYQINANLNKTEKINIILTYVPKTDFIVFGDVNLRRSDGTYLTNIQSLIKSIIKDNIDKKFKDINDREYLNGLRLYVNLTLEKPKVDAQVKTRIKNNISKQLVVVEKDLTRVLTSKNIMSILTSLLEDKITKKIINTSKNNGKRISNNNKLRDCQKTPGDVLYIVEGDSADGTLMAVRNKETEASFPLRGKMLNVEKRSLFKIEQNKEIKDLLEALGPPGNRRYRRIKILADADSDGAHISILATLFMQKFAPDMVKTGNVSVLLPPLFIGKKNNNRVPIYKIEDTKKYKEQGYSISPRFKGLGQMEPEELETVIRSGNEYIIKYPDDKVLMNLIDNIVNNTDVRKNLLEREEVQFEVILNQSKKVQ